MRWLEDVRSHPLLRAAVISFVSAQSTSAEAFKRTMQVGPGTDSQARDTNRAASGI